MAPFSVIKWPRFLLTKTRPGLDQIRDMAARGEVQAVIVYDPDRLSRSLAHLILLTEEFDARHIELHFVNSPREDTAEGKMLFGMRGLFAEYERTKIMERTRRGKDRKLREGKVMGTSMPPYGYRYVRGEARLEPIEGQLYWVVKMFEWLVYEHCSLSEIVRRLDKAGAPTKCGAPHWQRCSTHFIPEQRNIRGQLVLEQSPQNQEPWPGPQQQEQGDCH